VEIQRRFLQNITIPLSILATIGLVGLFEAVEARNPVIPRWRSVFVLLFAFLTSISSIQIGLSQSAYLQTLPEDLYYPASLDQAITWFGDHADYNDFVLATEQTSQVLAQKVGLRTYLGHEMETLNYLRKKEEVAAFFRGNMPALASQPVKWVVYGPLERQLSSNFVAPASLELAYDSPELQIYQVREK
jgi:hypothetical protein